MSETKFCKICKTNNKPLICPGYLVGRGDVAVCPFCGNKDLISVDISTEDLMIISGISSDINFIEAMIALKESDPIEYQLKMSQFKNQAGQQKQESGTQIKCPTCSSTNITRISATAKVTNVALFGLFGNKRKKTFHCKSCGYEW